MTQVRFGEALGTFTHEVAHNAPDALSHKGPFRHAMQAIFTTTVERLADVAAKVGGSEPLTEEEKVLLDIRNQWENLRAA